MGLRYDDRPVSRATDTTELPDRNTANTSPTGADTLRSAAAGSEVPLHSRGTDREASPPRHRPANLDLSQFNQANKAPEKNSPRSPRSFRSSFIMNSHRNSRNSIPQARRQEGHEKLESDPGTPTTIPAKEEQKEVVKAELRLGKNYEYFTGNTRFFMGGRWMNAREFPVYIATGLMIVIPGVLFLVFSAPDLWHLVSPAIPIIFAYVFLICFSSFLHASVSNPGVRYISTTMQSLLREAGADFTSTDPPTQPPPFSTLTTQRRPPRPRALPRRLDNGHLLLFPFLRNHSRHGSPHQILQTL